MASRLENIQKKCENTVLKKRPGAPVGLRPSPETKRRLQHYAELKATPPRRDWPVGMPSDTYAPPRDYEK